MKKWITMLVLLIVVATYFLRPRAKTEPPPPASGPQFGAYVVPLAKPNLPQIVPAPSNPTKESAECVAYWTQMGELDLSTYVTASDQGVSLRILDPVQLAGLVQKNLRPSKCVYPQRAWMRTVEKNFASDCRKAAQIKATGKFTEKELESLRDCVSSLMSYRVLASEWLTEGVDVKIDHLTKALALDPGDGSSRSALEQLRNGKSADSEGPFRSPEQGFTFLSYSLHTQETVPH